MNLWERRLMRNEHQRRRDVEAAYDDTYQPGPPDPADRSLAWYYLAWAIFGGLAATGALWWMGVL